MATKKVNSLRTIIFFQNSIFDLPENVRNELNLLVAYGWKFQVIDQVRGFMRVYRNEDTREINIPHWVCADWHRKSGKFTWYVAHELAHAIHFRDTERKIYLTQKAHGQEFMAILKRICPKDCIHFELGYQPIEAEKAGIVHSMKQN